MLLKIVGIGGGTGLPVLLSGLKKLSCSNGAGAWPSMLSISAVVCVSDNGGSSGALRRALGIPAVGDLRNCLVALSEIGFWPADLFQYRFSSGDGLQGHALGNLIVSALCQMHGDLTEATQFAARLVGSSGGVFPATDVPVTLCAEFENGAVVRGECQIAERGQRIRRLWLEPQSARPSRGVLQAIANADIVIFGPGSLYTSILPNLLVRGVAEALQTSQALKILVCNLMTQPGETDGFTAADHLRVVQDAVGTGVVNACVVNSRCPMRIGEYARSGSSPVQHDPDEISAMGVLPVVADVLADDQPKIRHDPVKLARAALLSFMYWTRRADRPVDSHEVRLAT